MSTLRRSRRNAAVAYHSNGRDYLAGKLGWDRGKLEAWLMSLSIRPHLQLWYQLCFQNARRVNDGIDWINTGEHGYFYNSGGLEEDLLLSCLGEGTVGKNYDEDNVEGYAGRDTYTHHWTTQEIWARSAWRIVEDNCGRGEVFEGAMVDHPAFAYGLAIDILMLAFHSLVCRASASVWHSIINVSEQSPSPTYSNPTTRFPEVELDQKSEPWENEDDESGVDESDIDMKSTPDSEFATTVESDNDFEEPALPRTSSILSGIIVATPATPLRAKQRTPSVLSEIIVAMPTAPLKRRQSEETAVVVESPSERGTRWRQKQPTRYLRGR